MPYSCNSRNFFPTFRCYRPSLVSSCGSSFPSNLVYSTATCSPSICQLGSSVYHGCQDTWDESTSSQRSCVVSSPLQTSWCYPRSPTPCRPCQPAYFAHQGFGSRGCFSEGCGSSGFRSLNYGVSCFPSVAYGSRFYSPNYVASRTYQPSFYRPHIGFGLFGFNC